VSERDEHLLPTAQLEEMWQKAIFLLFFDMCTAEDWPFWDNVFLCHVNGG